MTDNIQRDYLTFHLLKQPPGFLEDEVTPVPENSTGIYSFSIPESAYSSKKFGHTIKFKVKQFKILHRTPRNPIRVYLLNLNIRNSWESDNSIIGTFLTCENMSAENLTAQNIIDPLEYVLNDCPRDISFKLVSENPDVISPLFESILICLEFSYIPEKIEFNSAFKDYLN